MPDACARMCAAAYPPISLSICMSDNSLLDGIPSYFPLCPEEIPRIRKRYPEESRDFYLLVEYIFPFSFFFLFFRITI